ncbi:MAG: cyclic nucleotide-binding domain-containing protein [Mycobacterium sp.]|nr:cyclic nucleotide-binding domain-containing protein [Mycobacterium sp.]
MASDGKWYSPEQHPEYVPLPPPSPPVHRVTGLFRNAQQTLQVPAGRVVFQEGDPGNEMFGIVEGQIQLQTNNRIIALLGADDVFGEMALVDSSPRMATAVATVDTVLAVIDKHRFLFLVHETPTFALSVMSAMADRFRAQR